jgi:hypothetical protein
MRFNATLEQQVTISGHMATLRRLMRLKSGIAFDPARLQQILQATIDTVEAPPETPYLKQLTSNLLLPSNNGRQNIATAGKVFPVGIDSDFTHWGLNKPSTPTPAARTAVYEMQKSGTFNTLFTSLSSDVKKLCLTQAQIVQFCTSHTEWLRTDGYGTFFLFEENGECFVASVRILGGGLFVDVNRFERGSVWNTQRRRRHRVVCLQQTL